MQLFLMGKLFQSGFSAKRSGCVIAFLQIDDLDRLMRAGVFCAVTALMRTDPGQHIVGPTAVKRIVPAVKQIDEASFLLFRH